MSKAMRTSICHGNVAWSFHSDRQRQTDRIETPARPQNRAMAVSKILSEADKEAAQQKADKLPEVVLKHSLDLAATGLDQQRPLD